MEGSISGERYRDYAADDSFVVVVIDSLCRPSEEQPNASSGKSIPKGLPDCNSHKFCPSETRIHSTNHLRTFDDSESGTNRKLHFVDGLPALLKPRTRVIVEIGQAECLLCFIEKLFRTSRFCVASSSETRMCLLSVATHNLDSHETLCTRSSASRQLQLHKEIRKCPILQVPTERTKSSKPEFFMVEVQRTGEYDFLRRLQTRKCIESNVFTLREDFVQSITSKELMISSPKVDVARPGGEKTYFGINFKGHNKESCELYYCHRHAITISRNVRIEEESRSVAGCSKDITGHFDDNGNEKTCNTFLESMDLSETSKETTPSVTSLTLLIKDAQEDLETTLPTSSAPALCFSHFENNTITSIDQIHHHYQHISQLANNCSRGLDSSFPTDSAAVFQEDETRGCTSSFFSILQRQAAPIWSDHFQEMPHTCLSNGTTASREAKPTEWGSLPPEIQENILVKLYLPDLFRARELSKQLKNTIEGENFQSLRGEINPTEGSLTALHFRVIDGALLCTGFDFVLKTWRKIPPFTCLPAPDHDLFKEYSVSADGGLMCINVSKFRQKEKLIVLNPITKTSRLLPPLHYPRNPVLVHMLVNQSTMSYKVIAAGSASSGDEYLSRKTEVFDSKRSEWKVTGDLPGPDYALNEHQTGVYVNGILYCIAFLDGDRGRGALAYNVEGGEWLANWICPLPSSAYATIFQLIESNKEVYLFSELEQGGRVEHCIHMLVASHSTAEIAASWRNVMTETRRGSRGLQVYPEFICVPYGEGKLCIFNTVTYTGVIYDIHLGKRLEILQPPAMNRLGDAFYSLNPLTFTFQPSFKAKVF